MKRWLGFLSPLLLSCLFCQVSFAALASPSNLQEEFYEDEIPLENDLEDAGGVDNGKDALFLEILEHVRSIDSRLLFDDVATSSDASNLDPTQDVNADQGETTIYVNDTVLFAENFKDDYVNVLRFDVSVGSDSYILLFPPEYIDSLYIDAEKRLWNMSTQTIQGRCVDADFNPLAETGTLVFLTPCLGNNFSSIRNYGSPNYLREYYWNGSRYSYDDTYVEITVDKYYSPFFVSDSWNYLFFFLIGGGVLLLWLRTYKRY